MIIILIIVLQKLNLLFLVGYALKI